MARFRDISTGFMLLIFNNNMSGGARSHLQRVSLPNTLLIRELQ